MLIEKLIHRPSLARIFSSLIFLLVLVSASLLDIFLPVQAQQGGSTVPTPTPSPSMTPTVSVGCGRCIVWPNSDIRLDVADGRLVEIDQQGTNNLKDIPIVRSFGVFDNGSILTSTRSTIPPETMYTLQYNWSYGPTDCSGKLNPRVLLSAQAKFIRSYDPIFFDNTVIDSATEYQRFVPFFQAQNPNTLIGTYYSSMSCLEGATSPYVETYYPPSRIDCYRLAPINSSSMKTTPWGSQCPVTSTSSYIPTRRYTSRGNR
jgi:hypothetical protein